MSGELGLYAAPVVYGRVPSADKWWRCRPADLTLDQDKWLVEIVRSATVESFELRGAGGRRWFLAVNGELVFVGTAGMVGELAPEYAKVGVRDLHGVCGLVSRRDRQVPGEPWTTPDLSALQEDGVFAALTRRWLREDWDLPALRVETDRREPFEMRALPLGTPVERMALPAGVAGARQIVPGDRALGLWHAVATGEGPPSLCVGFGSERSARLADAFSLTAGPVGEIVEASSTPPVEPPVSAVPSREPIAGNGPMPVAADRLREPHRIDHGSAGLLEKAVGNLPGPLRDVFSPEVNTTQLPPTHVPKRAPRGSRWKPVGEATEALEGIAPPTDPAVRSPGRVDDVWAPADEQPESGSFVDRLKRCLGR